MNVTCARCSTINSVPNSTDQFTCYNCGAFLPKPKPPSGETSAAVGLLGGAALGAAIGGPFGAVIGGLIGAWVGSEAKGVG